MKNFAFYAKAQPSIGIAKIVFNYLLSYYPNERFGDVCETTSGGTPNRANADFYNGDIPWLKSGELTDGLVTDYEETITELGLKNSSAKIFPKDTLLVAMYGATAGKTGILNFDAATNQAVCAVFPGERIRRDFAFWYLKQQRVDFIEISRGGAQPNISQTVIKNAVIPCPDLDTQDVVVAFLDKVDAGSTYQIPDSLQAISREVDNLLLIRSRFEAANSELNYQSDYLTQIRQALLREAMQGRLLPQDPTDEPAAALLLQLQAAKAKSGKGKKGKVGPLFAQDAEAVEGPFDIPASWVWCTLGDLIIASDAGTSFQCANRPITGNEWGVIKLSAISWDKFLPEQNKFYSAEAPEELAAQIRTGDFIISRANTTELVGKSVVVQEGNYNLLLSDKSIRFTFSPLVSVAYANLYNNSQYARAHYANAANGSSPSMKNITQTNMRSLPIPLPPLAEQQRIVAKLGQLLGHCEALEQRIQESRRLAGQLLQTALREALAGPGGAEAAEQVEAAPAPASRRRGRPAKKAFQQGDYMEFGDLFDQPQ